MNLEIHQETPDQINQEEIQALRVHQVVQADLHQIDRDQIVLNQIDPHLRVHQVGQADLQEVALLRVHQADLQEVALHRVHQVVQADLVIQVVIEQEVRDPAEVEVHDLEKMSNAMIAVLN
jgi:ribosome maturation factor RimP